MLLKKINLIFILVLLYQTPLYSKSTSSNDINSKNLSKYFSGIVAFQNKDNSKALDYFNSSKILINKHDPYLKRYIYSLVLANKIPQAINVIKSNKDKKDLNFFDAHLLLILDYLNKNQVEQAYKYLININNFEKEDRFDQAILESLKEYIYVFKENKILENKKDFGKLSIISEAFQRCYLNDKGTNEYFLNLINDVEADYTRYNFFLLSFLIENDRIAEIENITRKIDYTSSTLLLSQGKSWIENGDEKNLVKVFSCLNANDIVSEFLFLVSNLYSSQDNFERSNFFLYLSSFLNPEFIYNFSLMAENKYFNGEYKKVKKIIKNFKKEDNFYYWYRVKKEAQIIAKQRNKKESLNYITAEFNKIEKPNDKILFDIANFYRNSKEYKEAIKYYTKIIDTLDDNSEIKQDLLYRRGGSFERIGEYTKADRDLLHSIKINPNDAYVLNYLAYSWLERDFKIDEAIEMLEKAYSLRNDDPYIIDSIGWAYYLTNDFPKAEKYLKRAVELMPHDPIVNDHYGDILWKLDRKIQARYFWANVLKMDDAEKKIIDSINIKMIKGL
jgi:tetratricopeptide (TPR) repeat protein